MKRDNDSWIHQLQQADSAALDDLRSALVRHLQTAFIGNARIGDAFIEDIVQDAVLRILGKLDQYAGRSRFLTWATAIAIHLAFSELRRSRWKDVSLTDTVRNDGGAAVTPVTNDLAPHEQLERNTMLEAMRNLITTELTERQRTVVLAELRGMPQEEIAQHLGSNRNAVYKLTHDARRKLKSALEARGYTVADVAALVAG